MSTGEMAGWAAVVVSIISTVVVYGQLRNMAESLKLAAAANRTSNLMAVLALESSLAEARARLSDMAGEVALIAKDDEKNKVDDGVALKFAQLRYEERKEQYLNAADRLCACIVRGEVDENQYRQDYRPWIAEIVKQHADKLGPDTRHRNIIKIHNAWSEDKSAAATK